VKFDAAVMHAVNAPLAIEEVELAPLAPDDVLVRIRATGLCHTDLEAMQGSLVYPMPIVLGHEGAGVVEAVGSNVTELQAGDHVVCSWNPHCGHCFHCERDQPILCEPFTRHQPKGLLLAARRGSVATASRSTISSRRRRMPNTRSFRAPARFACRRTLRSIARASSVAP
jgi:Zn-dependent alcohol dehydrogenase